MGPFYSIKAPFGGSFLRYRNHSPFGFLMSSLSCVSHLCGPGREEMRVSRRLEPLHLPFLLPGWLV